MPVFDFVFTVKAPLQAVTAFHADPRALKKLNPPFVIVQPHRVDLMAEGSISEFTLWMGPIPIRWRAVHRNIGSNGFTDTQESGPLKSWQHSHRFEALDEDTAQIHEHIEYEYNRGLLTRLLFGWLGLMALFTYRKLATRWALRRK